VRDSNGRASGFRFHSPDTNFVTVLNPGVPDPFARPLLSCADAARLPQQWIGRVRISGTVTAYRPDEGFYLDDGTGVMHVQLLQPLAPLAGSEHLEHEPQTWLKPGERVEVIGLRRNWYSLAPSLIQAEYREMPGLSLKADQVQRLCGVEREPCKHVLDTLVKRNFLRLKSNGAYARLIDRLGEC